MKKLESVLALVTLLVVLPIWYYLMYQILVRVNATELMWFLFWVYIPVNFIMSGIAKIIEVNKE